jgi:hypothetical protein
VGTPNFANLVRVSEGWKKPGAEVRGVPYIEPVRYANTRIFTVQFSAFDPLNALNACFANDGTTAVPQTGAFWGTGAPYLVCARVRNLDPQNPFVFRVLCEYAGQNSPLSQPPILREGGQEHEEEIGYDAMGKVYQNTNGQRLSGMSRPFYDGVFTITRNEATDQFVGSDAWRGVVNLATLTLGSWSWAAKKVLIRNITSPRQVYPSGADSGSVTMSAITLSGGVYTIAVLGGLVFAPGTSITCGDGAGNSIAGVVASISGTSLVISETGLTVVGTPASIPSGTAISYVAGGTGVTFFWPITYELVIRKHSVAYNGASAADIGWQQLIENHGNAYRATAGGKLISTLKPPMCLPDVLLKQDGTLWDITNGDTASTLYFLLFDRFPTADFSALALGI